MIAHADVADANHDVNTTQPKNDTPFELGQEVKLLPPPQKTTKKKEQKSYAPVGDDGLIRLTRHKSMLDEVDDKEERPQI